MAKNPLGRVVGHVIMVPRTSIRPFKNQPRKYFDEESLEALATSLKTRGQQVPMLVERTNDDACPYELVDGERRWRAAEIAGIENMKAIVVVTKDKTDQFVASFVANLGHKEHTPLEIARALSKIQKEADCTAQALANLVGRSTTWVYDHLALMDLVPEVQQLLEPTVPEKQRLPFGVAVKLATLPKSKQKEAAQTIVDEEMSAKLAADYIKVRFSRTPLGRAIVSAREPRKNLELFDTFLRRIEKDGLMFLEWPQHALDAMFASKTGKEYETFLKRVEACVVHLEGLRAAVKRVKANSMLRNRAIG